MKNAQALTDKFAISLSVLCAMHCLMLPILLVVLPSLTALNLQNEAFHLWMLATVSPSVFTHYQRDVKSTNVIVYFFGGY